MVKPMNAVETVSIWSTIVATRYSSSMVPPSCVFIALRRKPVAIR